MRKSNHEELEIRAKEYKKIFQEECIPPQELARSELNYLCNGQFALMHAHSMTLLMEKMHEDGENERAFHLLGVIETILSSHKLLTTDKMFD